MLGRTLQPGQRLAGYQLIRSLSDANDAATTWLAFTPREGRLVALKTVGVNALDDPELESLFLSETRRAAQVHHPRVAETLSSGLEDGFLYVAMQWVDGVPLRSLLRAAAAEGGMPLAIAVKLGLELCEGMAAVHAAGPSIEDDGALVHGALSPQSVFVTLDGHVSIIDLGVGRVLGRTSGATTFRHMLGKFSYLSPEQLWSRPVDVRTDTFAIGLLLYEMATAKHPFQGPSERQTTTRILSPERAATPSEAVAGFPSELERVLMRAIEKPLEQRFADAAELGAALAQAVSSDAREVAPTAVVDLLQRLLPREIEQHRQQVEAAVEQMPLTSESRVSSAPPPAVPRATDWARGAEGHGGGLHVVPATVRARWHWAALALTALVVGVATAWFAAR